MRVWWRGWRGCHDKFAKGVGGSMAFYYQISRELVSACGVRVRLLFRLVNEIEAHFWRIGQRGDGRVGGCCFGKVGCSGLMPPIRGVLLRSPGAVGVPRSGWADL